MKSNFDIISFKFLKTAENINNKKPAVAKLEGELMTKTLFLIAAVLLTALFLVFKNSKEAAEKHQAEIENYEKKIKGAQSEIAALKADLKNKLKKARTIHQRMLPDNLIEPEDYLISDYYQPAEYIGGDYYNIFRVDHGSMDPFFEQYLIYFFDVSGHGIDSTLLSIFVNESIENYFRLRHSPGEKISTAELMAYIDSCYQQEDFPDDYLVCLFMAVLDRKNNILSYSSGGFQYPIYKTAEKKELSEINIGGLPISSALGALKDSRPEKKIKFEENDLLFLSTDGLLEQENKAEAYYQRLQKILKNYKFLPAPFLNDLVQNDFYNFTDNNPGDDDITYLILERPEAEIKNYSLKKESKSSAEIEQSVLKFIRTKLDLNSRRFKSFYQIISEIFKLLAGTVKIKVVDSKKMLLLSFEKNKGENNTAHILNKFPRLKLAAEQAGDLLNSEDNSFDFKEIYFSCSRNKHKIYFLVFKDIAQNKKGK